MKAEIDKLARNAIFWNRLQGAIREIGAKWGDHHVKLRGDWLSEVRAYFREHRWVNAERIEPEHLDIQAHDDPHFVRDGDQFYFTEKP